MSHKKSRFLTRYELHLERTIVEKARPMQRENTPLFKVSRSKFWTWTWASWRNNFLRRRISNCWQLRCKPFPSKLLRVTLRLFVFKNILLKHVDRINKVKKKSIIIIIIIMIILERMKKGSFCHKHQILSCGENFTLPVDSHISG